MKKTNLLFLLFLTLLTNTVQAQTSFWESADAYLGQKPPGSTPKIFAPRMLADSPYFSANRPAFSADGKEFYYCYNLSWANKVDLKIKYFKFEDGKWKGPTILNEHYFAPTLSMDDQTLYFEGEGANIWCSHRKDTGWREPARFLEPIPFYDFVPTISGTLYGASGSFVGAEKKPNNVDVCTLSISGSDTSIQSLGVPINVPGWNGDFFVARDESFMILSANETPSFQDELYISYRKPGNTWTNPKSLGSLINKGLAHRYGQYVTNDNKFLFYCYGTSEKDCAIYWVRFDKLFDSLKHTNFDPYVLNPIPDQTVLINKKFTVQIPEKTFIDDDGSNTLRYTAHLTGGDPLPSWLHFDPAKKILFGSGTAEGKYNITVTATDTKGARAQCVFALTLAKS